MKKLLQDSDAVVHFCISREMSSCYADACEVARKLRNIYVVDSRNLSTGIGLLVLEACEMAKMGKSAEEIFEAVKSRTSKVVATFVVQDIGYLYRGGRCSGLEAIGAKLMHIRPSITVRDGKNVQRVNCFPVSFKDGSSGHYHIAQQQSINRFKLNQRNIPP